jgi:predicted ATP-dependent endonuclease of OLD family
VGAGFKIFSKATENEIQPAEISSGEAELISLGIEASAFAQELDVEKANYLFLDEPDVHLHPDLQDRLVKFLTDL